MRSLTEPFLVHLRFADTLPSCGGITLAIAPSGAIGWSICRPDEAFDRKFGRETALYRCRIADRALANPNAPYPFPTLFALHRFDSAHPGDSAGTIYLTACHMLAHITRWGADVTILPNARMREALADPGPYAPTPAMEYPEIREFIAALAALADDGTPPAPAKRSALHAKDAPIVERQRVDDRPEQIVDDRPDLRRAFDTPQESRGYTLDGPPFADLASVLGFVGQSFLTLP